jgi:hypothetical protein
LSYLTNFLGGAKRRADGILFAQTSTASCTNTVTETTISSSGLGSLTLPANFFMVGRSLKFEAFGYHSSTGNPTITIKIKYGSTVIATMTGSSGNGTNNTFSLIGVTTCRTIGSSGLVFTQSALQELHSNGLRVGNNATATVTINTTTSNAISITAQWGTANSGNNIHLTNFILTAIN